MAVPSGERRSTAWRWYCLFIVPCGALLIPALYARRTPVLFGFPFFYWYPIAWIVATAVITAVVYLKTPETPEHG